MTSDGEIFDAFYRPVREHLESIDLTMLSETEPAFAFDPSLTAGEQAPSTRWDTPPEDLSAAARGVVDQTLTFLSTTEIAAALGKGYLAPDLVVSAYAERIRVLDGKINAFLTRLEPTTSDLSNGPLKGVPFGVKDVIEIKGVRTTAGSRQLLDHVPLRDAEVVRRLKAVGAVLMGKLNTHEFAAGATGDNTHFGPAHNPWNLDYLCGGSSSGPAAAVAARMLPFALGTDTAGSVRVPAACCGVVGLKPTYDLISREGILPLSWSLDHVGILCRTVRDAGMILGILARQPTADYERATGTPIDLHGLRVGIAQAWIDKRIQPGVRAAFEAAIRVLEGLGCVTLHVDIPAAEDLGFITRAILLPEASAWHQRYLRSTPEYYGDDVRARNEVGLKIPAVDYLNAQRSRASYCRKMSSLWSETDVVVVPTVPTVAPPLGASPDRTADLTRLTAWVNLLGWPAISVPCGFAEDDLPVGLQLTVPLHREARLLRVAAAYENSTDWTYIVPKGIGSSLGANEDTE